MKTTVKERLAEFLKYKGTSQRKFEISVGLSNGYVNNIRQSIQPEKIKNIAQVYPDLNTGWLLTGEGEMLKTQGETIRGVMLGVVNDKSEIIDEAKKNIQELREQANINTVPLLPISAQAGTLNDFIVSIKNIDVERIISPIKSADYAITVTGDSMAPEYSNGSQILIKKINENSFIEWGKVYVLDTTNGVVLKIINQCKEQPDCLLCTSINADQDRYAPFNVPKYDILGMYRVMMCMSMK